MCDSSEVAGESACGVGLGNPRAAKDVAQFTESGCIRLVECRYGECRIKNLMRLQCMFCRFVFPVHGHVLLLLHKLL